MTHNTITIPPVTAALLAHGVTDWSTHDFRGSVEPGDRGIIVAGAGKVTSEDVPEGWFHDDEHNTPPLLWEPHDRGGRRGAQATPSTPMPRLLSGPWPKWCRSWTATSTGIPPWASGVLPTTR